MRGVRLTEIGWQGQCDKCRQWWPLDLESWQPRHGMRRCNACVREERRAYIAKLREDNPDMRARHREASRENQAEKRRVSRDEYLEYQRRWYAAHHVKLNAERAELHAIRAEIAGRKISRQVRDETPETLAIRREFRAQWVRANGPIRGPHRDPVTIQQTRERKREWMRRKRAA